MLFWKLTELQRSVYHRPLNPKQWQPYKLLVDACQRGDIEYVRNHLDDNTLPKDWWRVLEFNFTSFSPLDAAAQAKHHEIMQLLLHAETEGLYRQYREPQFCLLLTVDPDDETIGLLVRHGERTGIDWQRHLLSSYVAENQLPVSAILKLMRHGLWSDDWRPTYPTPYAPLGHALLTKEGTSRERQEEIVRVLLLDDTRLDKTCEIEDGYYPVHMAAGYGSEGILRMILHEFHADPNKLTDVILLQTGARPDSLTFEVALRYRSPEIVQIIWNTWKVRDAAAPLELLIGAAAVGDIEVLQKSLPLCLSHDNDECLSMALRRAVEFKRDLAIEALLDHGTLTFMTSQNIHEILLTIPVHGTVDTLKRSSSNGRIGEGYPPGFAASLGHTEIVLQLLNHGVGVDTKVRGNSSLLIEAAKNGHPDTTRFLIESGARVNAVDEDGRSALSWAALGHPDVFKILLQAGAEVDAVGNQEYTPFAHAIIDSMSGTDHLGGGPGYGGNRFGSGHGSGGNFSGSFTAAMGSLLGDFGKSISLIGPSKKPCPTQDKHRADKLRAEVGRILLEHGASCLDGYGYPQYRFAIDNDLGEILQLYIERALVPVDVVDGKKRSLLLRAVEKNHHSVARALVNAGCDVVKGDSEGTTPLKLYRNDEMVKILYWRR
ncbi:ankyrin repeat-containing domain protein [Aspergillus venezuelensis]